ncbi:argininosuccinate lyase [Melghiribacillus thermohalophilus]|uniref:Argininosuccinate lyase n=1 Tax=Melghiribacillus thermohalophilus TaxID=1324956 RepID=A0A4R3NAH9_9BACI|nr:argininosuccinate lyase [Melghiribacillus thermohalophilus]TCT26484.1 argininosuccinate lyase [Melghiribacillus thermohalophilus]
MNSLKQKFESRDGAQFPGKTYVEELLKPVFNDQKEYLLEPMLEIHKAHTIMLAEQGIISPEEKNQILNGIDQVRRINGDDIEYSSEYEDLFFVIESKFSEIIGEELAGKMHIAKSRNDLGETMYRMVLRGYLEKTISEAETLRKTILYQAEQHIHTIMPAHTHTQPAQPTTFGHYLVAIHDNLSRDIQRIKNALKTINQSPMGAAALTTTGFPINRERVADLLDFEGVLENSYDAIGTADYLIDAAQVLVSLMTNIGRWVQELLRMASKEVGLLEVSDAYVQTSSIMPQKRNPVSLEHSRAIASSAAAEGLGVIHMIHNTPYGDINDTEDDLQPHLYNGYKKAIRVLRLLNAVILTMNIDKQKAFEQARKNMITITELADVLARNYNMPFRKAHAKASQIARNAYQLNLELFEIPLNQVNEWIGEVKINEKEWSDITNPFSFVERRKVTGGPAPEVVQSMIEKRKRE